MSKIKLALDVVSDLKSLAESIETLVHAIETNEPITTNEVAEVPNKKKSKAKATKVEDPMTEEPEVEEVQEENKPAPEEKQPTLEEVRAAMADKSRDGHREAVKAIITKYGANNLSSMDPKHYASALKEVGELK
jgi:predicted transcriptional regulator